MPRTAYVVASQDWPVTGTSDVMTDDEILGVLDKFDDYLEPALAGLKDAVAPAANQEHPAE